MSTSKLDLGAGVSNTVQEPFPPGTPAQHGEASQFSRILALGSYFISGCMAINASQFLGAPLYLVNENWYNAWIAFTKQSFGLLTTTMTQCWAPTVIRASGDASVRGQLLKTADGNLLCNFPQRLVLIANHQIYTDWMYLWYIAYTADMHGRLFIILKESLKRIPVIGWGMQLSQFIFLKRNWEKDKPNMAEHLQKLNQAADPMWLMIFPEGTNLATCTREKSAAYAEKRGIRDMRHQLLPRTTGLEFCLQQLRQTVGYVYDCTIAYEGVPPGEYAQDIFTLRAAYVEGRPPKSVNMYWRRFAISSIPIDNPQAFEIWLLNRWYEKDNLLEYYHRNGRFPADVGVEKTASGKIRRGAGYIETEIKSFRWYEFMQIFAPIGLFALVLYSFYGSLPGNVLKTIVDKVGAAEQEQMKIQQQEKKPPTAAPQTASRIASKKAAAAPKLPTKKKPIRQAPAKATKPPKAVPAAPSTKQPTTNPAKKPQPKAKQVAATSKPPKLDVPRAVPPTVKKPTVKPAVKPAIKPAAKPAAPKKPAPTKPAATKSSPEAKSKTSAAPKKPATTPKTKPSVPKPAVKPAAPKKVEKRA